MEGVARDEDQSPGTDAVITATVRPVTDQPPAYLNQREAAALLRISVKALRRETDAGHIPAVRIGRTVRYSRATLLSLDQGEIAARNAADDQL